MCITKQKLRFNVHGGLVKKNGVYLQVQTSSLSPFARKSRIDMVLLYLNISAMNSAPFGPIYKGSHFTLLYIKEKIVEIGL